MDYEWKKEFNNFKNAESEKIKLYRFVPIDKYLQEHFRTQTLFFSNPAEHFNDPLDCLPLQNKIWHSETKFDEFEKLRKLVTNDVIRVRCFNKIDCLNQGDYNGILNLDFTHPQNENDFNFNLMFAHYGDNHKGVLIEYELDPNKLPDDIKLLKVNYKSFDRLFCKKIKMRPICSKKILNSSLCDKLNNWKYENEYRLVWWSENVNVSEEGKKDFTKPLNEIGLKINKVIFGLNLQDTVDTGKISKADVINSFNASNSGFTGVTNEFNNTDNYLCNSIKYQINNEIIETWFYNCSLDTIEQKMKIENLRFFSIRRHLVTSTHASFSKDKNRDTTGEKNHLKESHEAVRKMFEDFEDIDKNGNDS